MKKTKALSKRKRHRPELTFAFQLPDELVKRVDHFKKRIEDDTGLVVSRSAAVRLLLGKALDQDEKAIADELVKFAPPREEIAHPGMTGKIHWEQRQQGMREAKAARKRAKGTRCPKCGTITETISKGKYGTDATTEVCAECGTKRVESP